MGRPLRWRRGIVIDGRGFCEAGAGGATLAWRAVEGCGAASDLTRTLTVNGAAAL